MNIDYTYEIVEVDAAAKCMVVVYSAEGHETMQIGAPLPFEGEELENVIRNYAPASLWVARVTPVTVPLVGTTGVLSSIPAVDVSLVTGGIPVTAV
jgi:hypothetical protein